MELVMYHAKHNKLGVYWFNMIEGKYGWWLFENLEEALERGWQVIGEL